METESTPTPKTRTFDAQASASPAAASPVAAESEQSDERFIPSGLEGHEVYGKTQIRRWERYQLPTIRAGLQNIGVESLNALDDAVKDPEKLEVIAGYLQTCLTNPSRRLGAIQLFRKGRPGLRRMLGELAAREILRAMKIACKHVDLFGEKE